MAEQEPKTNETLDFTDLAEETPFRFKGKLYRITAITYKVAKDLFAMQKAMPVPVKPEAGADVQPTLEEDGHMQWVMDFMVLAVVREDGSPVTTEDVDTWPMNMVQRVVKMVNERILGPLDTPVVSSTP